MRNAKQGNDLKLFLVSCRWVLLARCVDVFGKDLFMFRFVLKRTFNVMGMPFSCLKNWLLYFTFSSRIPHELVVYINNGLHLWLQYPRAFSESGSSKKIVSFEERRNSKDKHLRTFPRQTECTLLFIVVVILFSQHVQFWQTVSPYNKQN